MACIRSCFNKTKQKVRPHMLRRVEEGTYLSQNETA